MRPRFNLALHCPVRDRLHVHLARLALLLCPLCSASFLILFSPLLRCAEQFFFFFSFPFHPGQTPAIPCRVSPPRTKPHHDQLSRLKGGGVKGVTTLNSQQPSLLDTPEGRRGEDELQAPADRRSDRTMTGGGRDHVAGGLDRGGFHRQLPPCVQTWHRMIHWPLVPGGFL